MINVRELPLFQIKKNYNQKFAGDILEHFNLPYETAISFEKIIGNGITDPVLMGCSNGYYVVKAANNPHGVKVLINEYVCYKLAKLLGLPIPEAALINIKQDLINSSDQLSDLGFEPGVHFGSSFVQRSTNPLQPPMMKIAQNLEDAPSIILFDHIIYNDDRTINKGNLLFDLKAKKILIIDHSHVFKLGGIWDPTQLQLINKEAPQLVKDFYGHNYKILLEYVNGFNPFHKIVSNIKTLTISDLEWCLEGMPSSWALTESDRKALLDFLWFRINNIERFLEILKEACPNWKGGDIYE